MNKKIKEISLFVIIGLVLIEFVSNFMGVSYPKLDYLYYNKNYEKYMVIDAYVKKSNQIIIIPGKIEPVVSIVKNQVIYEINGIKYTNNIFTYPEVSQSDYLKIAVAKSNVNDIRRCIPFMLSKSDKLDTFCTTMVIVIFLLLFFINELFIKKNKKRRTSGVVQINERCDNNEKKQKILNLCVENILNIPLDNEINTILGCDLNKDFIWCLENLHNQEEIKEILLVQHDLDGQYEFIMKTLSLREKGLPPNYYVVANEQQHFLCGREDSSRLYLFSYSLGITNTKYANIFDYILERLNEKR